MNQKEKMVLLVALELNKPEIMSETERVCEYLDNKKIPKGTYLSPQLFSYEAVVNLIADFHNQENKDLIELLDCCHQAWLDKTTIYPPDLDRIRKYLSQ
jgi:hypothetical protein